MPLIVWKSDARFAGQDDRLARLIDVAPTILDMAGKGAHASWSGISLFRGTRQSAFSFSSTIAVCKSVFARTAKFILDYGRGKFSRYRLDRDPNERFPIELTDRQRERAEATLGGWVHRERLRYRQ